VAPPPALDPLAAALEANPEFDLGAFLACRVADATVVDWNFAAA